MTSSAQTVRPVTREPWVDNLRVVLIAGVIVLHTATGYVVDFAGWYYDDELDASGPWSAALTVPGLLGALFWLGPLFLVAGWFSARSLERRGPGGFARSRLLRLGVPLVVFVLLVQPLTDYLGNIHDERGSFAFYLRQTETGAMWFVAALLVFSLAYAGLRRLHPAPTDRRPRARVVLPLSMATIAVTSWTVWLFSPLTEEAPLNVRVAEWPQGAVLFALGVLAAEVGWVEQPPSLHRVRLLGWLALAGSAGFVGVLAIGVASGQEDFGPPTDWPTIAVAVLDGFVAVSFTVWFVVWFRGHWPRHGALVGEAARASYATYFIHPLVITAVMLAVAPVDLGAWAKFVLVSAVSVPASFAVGYGLTRLPGVSKVL